MSSAEFTHWKAYANVEPFGYPMDNYRMGVPAAMLANTINGTVGWKRKPRQWKASDLEPEQKRGSKLTPRQQAYKRKKRAKRK